MAPNLTSKKPSKISRMRRRLRSRGSLLPAAVLFAIFVSVAVPVYKLYHKVRDDDYVNGDDDPNLLPLYRDVYSQDSWPGVEWNWTQPSQAHHTVHYLWCGQKTFRFQHHLAVLSIVRVLQPLKLVLHYTHLPVVDSQWYHTWFLELQQSLPGLETRPLPRASFSHDCGSVGMLREMLRVLSAQGGVFVGEGVVLSRNVDHLKLLPFWFAFSDARQDATAGVVFVNSGFNENTLEDYVQVIQSNTPVCVSVDDYDLLEAEEEESLEPMPAHRPMCVSLKKDIYPRDIRSSDTPFAELARWLYYGRRAPFSTPHGGLVDNIPRVSHYVWLSAGTDRHFTFTHYLSVLSALHVAKLDHVYFHGDRQPQGSWWEALRTENVTFILLDPPRSVFQQAIGVPAHAADLVRYLVLYKYGGVYQDIDVIWVNRLPDWLLGYPSVAGPEWPRYGQWPDSLNLGVLLARRHADFLRHFLSSYRYFRDGDWNFNAVLMPYRTYERFPDTIFVDQFLQAICFHGACHAAWMEEDDNDDYNTAIPESDPDKPQFSPPPFDLREVRAVHLREPKTPASLASPQAVKDSSDMLADVARYVLSQSKSDLLES